MKTLIYGGVIINEGRACRGSVVADDDIITQITEDTQKPRGTFDNVVDATGCFVLPGVIDEHVHFREPGLTEKADIESESRAAAWGGVTSYLDMPNCVPQTVTAEALGDKRERAARESHVNYGFFFGATSDNAGLFSSLDRHAVPGIKLFMGASTGNMLVDNRMALEKIFSTAAALDLPVMTHCEDTAIINANMAAAKEKYGDDPDISLHPLIRSEEACVKSSRLAMALAEKFGTRLHIAHITTAAELDMARHRHCANISLEACPAHLLFDSDDYLRLGALIKCNPAVKTVHDRDALRQAVADGTIYCIGTDHAPHERSRKEGGCAKAASGMPMLQYSLVSMLELTDKGIMTKEHMVELMAHNPARLFAISKRGFLRTGYKADITIVRNDRPFTVTKENIQSKCKWSPLEGHTFRWSVDTTICNGKIIYRNGIFDDRQHGQALVFRADGDIWRL